MAVTIPAGTAAYIAAGAAVVGAAVTAIGQLQAGPAQKAAGAAAANAAAYQAQIAEREAEALDIRAGQERASAQRGAIDERRRAGLVNSRAKLLAAAGGGAVDSPDVQGIMGAIENEGEYRALTALYEGEQKARGYETGAQISRAGGAGQIYAGEVARNAGSAAASRSYLAAGGSLLAGAGSAASTYYRAGLGTGFTDSNYLYDPLRRPGLYG